MVLGWCTLQFRSLPTESEYYGYCCNRVQCYVHTVQRGPGWPIDNLQREEIMSEIPTAVILIILVTQEVPALMSSLCVFHNIITFNFDNWQ